MPALTSPVSVAAPGWARAHAAVAAAAPIVVLVALSVLLRTTVLGTGYWTDESIAVGIAAKPLGAIPATLRLDGSPPLYYLLLHGWMALVGSGEVATRCLSLLLAAAAVPVALWAGRTLFGAHAGRLAAVAIAALPFETRYAQETRMYALVVLLSVLVAATAVRALRSGARRDAVALAAAVTALLYTHNWGLFLAAAVALAWVLQWRRGRASGSAGLLALALVAAAYAPWVPSLLFQVQHTAAPWAQAPAVWRLLLVPVALAGIPGTVAIGAALGVAAWRRRPAAQTAAGVAVARWWPAAQTAAGVAGAWRRMPVPDGAGLLVGIAAGTAGIAWLANQGEAAWAERYLAVLVGPAVLGVSAVLAAVWSRATLALVLAAVLAGAAWSPPPVKSNARALARALAPELHAGDVALVAGPQHVPLMAGYLPAGLRYLTPAGPVADTSVTDWRDLVSRLRAADTTRLAQRTVAALPVGRRIVLVAPFELRGASSATLPSMVRRRSIELSVTLAGDSRLRRVGTWATGAEPGVRTVLRATVYERVPPRHGR